MKAFRKILRAVVLTLLFAAVIVPAALFIVLSTPWAREKMRSTAETELTRLLGTEVRIDGVSYHPFNSLAVTGIHVDDPTGAPALEVASAAVRFELGYFLRTRRLVFDYAVLEGPHVALWKATPDTQLNIQPIIDRLQPKDKTKPPTDFDLRIGTLVIRSGSLKYDVRSIARREHGFDAAHIAVTDLNLYAYLRHASRQTVNADIESMSLREQCGFCLTDLHADAYIAPDKLELREFGLRMPGSSIELKPFALPLDGLNSITASIREHAVDIATARAAVISPADLLWLTPGIAGINRDLILEIDAAVSLRHARLRKLKITDRYGFDLMLTGTARDIDTPDAIKASLDRLEMSVDGSDAAEILHGFSPDAAKILGQCGRITVNGTGSGDKHSADLDLKIAATGGTATVHGRATAIGDDWHNINFEGSLSATDINAGLIANRPQLGRISASAEGSGRIIDKKASADGKINIDRLDYNGYTYTGITAEGSWDTDRADIRLASADPNAIIDADVTAVIERGHGSYTADINLTGINPHALHLTRAREGYVLSGRLTADISASDMDDIDGNLEIKDLDFAAEGKPSLHMTRLAIDADRSSTPQTISISSDWLNGTVEGVITPSTLVPVLRDMASHIVPALLPHDESLHRHLEKTDDDNDFTLDLTLGNAENLSKFLNLPLQIIYPVDIDATVSSSRGIATFSVDAPYLQQGDKIIDSTVLSGSIDADAGTATLYASTRMPSKKGPMTAIVGINGADNTFDTSINWMIERKIPLNGQINFSTDLALGDDKKLCADTHFAPGEINFGDDVWRISPSSINWCDGRLTATDFSLSAGDQSIAIDGTASPEPSDSITVRLDKIHLASIFETLEIDKALIGGTATGTFTAYQALSKLPLLATDDLHVDSIGYNYCTLGDADIRAGWSNERSSFWLDADVINPEGQHSHIWGDIFPLNESLDLSFDARHVKVGFMKPFMEAFASDVQGFVSGKARLFGTFKDIDLEGDVLAEDLKLKIDFTNTWYTATDSIHILPGRINLDNITIHDVNGHTAKLNGWLRHDYFHNPVFDFRITDAVDFLSYNVTSHINPDWYGTIYGNGSAHVVGRPGVIEIGVNMSTAPNSTFTFVLSDRLEAEQYSFITFRDRTELKVDETIEAIDDIPAAVKEYQARMMAQNIDPPSTYLMDIRVDITPDAQMILVMDPVGGDRIRANGNGDLRMTYNSADNDLRMYGTYTLDRGSYNFTLQDIIIKDFTINRGSSITFRGDPYSAQLDIEAVYAVNANLSDLDKSFLQDKDLNRTNVPVHALLKVTGDMRQPDLAFDLAFPTLTSDIYRKVRSIISTDDMMNRQIIYLLALNRFYTPDYMASTTKGNEIFSVASSTISSQLSSMLGKLSENWSIAPNLRSDRGDFSDLEVDVALSSRLLNNRLLFNGNFGYRDRSLNSNQFIGDFDIEYLLNPKGTWRLKAYNRYNDQNYYVRSAATTQGIGIMVRRDFDNIFSWLRPKRHVKPDSTSTPTAAPADTITPGDTSDERQ
ncbi:MAG: translocation/assembly module TamB domain-containing protein [Bacteroidales bacterium]|nr:translocation/assembly module TamB domain-containing protein [Bacteroidales bacterium]